MADASPSGLKSQLAKLSPSERMLLTLLSMLFPIGALFLAYNFQSTAGAAHDVADTHLRSAELAAGRTSSGKLAEDIQKARADVRAWSWEGNSVAVAQVKAQADVTQLATTAGLVNPEIKTSEKLEPAGDVTFAPIDITAPFSWTGLSGFMAGLAGTGKGFLLEEVQLTTDKEPKLRISLKVPLVVSPPGPAPKKTAAKPAAPAAKAAAAPVAPVKGKAQ